MTYTFELDGKIYNYGQTDLEGLKEIGVAEEEWSKRFLESHSFLKEMFEICVSYVSMLNMEGEDQYYLNKHGFNHWTKEYQLWVSLRHNRKRGGFYFEYSENESDLILITPAKSTDDKKFTERKGFNIRRTVVVENDKFVVIRNKDELLKFLNTLFDQS